MNELTLKVSFVELEQLVDRWRSKVEEARGIYEVATRSLKLLESSHRLMPPDERTLAQARAEQARALNEYRRVLEIFTDLAMNDRVPDINIDHKSRGASE